MRTSTRPEQTLPNSTGDGPPLRDESRRIRGAAPTSASQLALFVRLVDDYNRLCAAFPSSIGAHELFDSPISDTERWHRIVRALSIRKFLLGAQDAVSVDLVIAHFEACLLDPRDPAIVDLKLDSRRIREELGDDVAVLKDILYGELLHGGHEENVRHNARSQYDKDVAVWNVGQSGELLVRNLQSAIIRAAQAGRLQPDPAALIEAERRL